MSTARSRTALRLAVASGVEHHLRSSPTASDRPGLLKAVRSFLHSVQKRPRRVASYFRSEHVTYAA